MEEIKELKTKTKTKTKTRRKKLEEPKCPPNAHILEADGGMFQLLKKKDGEWVSCTDFNLRIILTDDCISQLFAASHPLISEEQAKYEKYLVNLPKIKTLARKDRKLRQLL